MYGVWRLDLEVPNYALDVALRIKALAEEWHVPESWVIRACLRKGMEELLRGRNEGGEEERADVPAACNA